MTGSEKSPPGGDTLRKEQKGELSYSPYNMCRVMSPSSGTKLYSRSYNTDAAFPLWVTQTLHPSSTLIEGGETGAQVGRITTVCGQIHKIRFVQRSLGTYKRG